MRWSSFALLAGMIILGMISLAYSQSTTIVINEVEYDTPHPQIDKAHEWFELYNKTTGALTIDSWTITDNEDWDAIPTIIIPALGSVVVAADKDQFLTDHPGFPNPDLVVGLGGSIGNGLNNNGDRLILRNGSDVIIDQLSYGDDTAVLNPSIPDVAPGHSIRRNPNGVDTDTAADWIDESSPSPDYPLPITLSSFTATLAGDHVLVRWVTQSESDHLGFHVLRATERHGPYVRITEAIIPGAPGGYSTDRRTYALADPDVAPGHTYFYRLEEVSLQGERATHGPVSVTIALRPHTLPLRDAVPTRYALLQNTPNPFNPSTVIWYALPRREKVEVVIYNIRGQQIRTLREGIDDAGWHTVSWDGRDEAGSLVGSGIYVVRLRTAHFVDARKMVKVE